MLAAALDGLAEQTGSCGVIRVDLVDTVEIDRAYGYADHAHQIPMTTQTQLAVASGSKLLTALAVMTLVSDGAIALSTTARSLPGRDLPMIDDDVTVEHLLSHRSGIGDYLDEAGDLHDNGYPPVSTHKLASTEVLRPRSLAPSRTDPRRYGRGVWLHATTSTAIIDGSDAGVSFRSHHEPTSHRIFTVISNTSAGAWPMVSRVDPPIPRLIARVHLVQQWRLIECCRLPRQMAASVHAVRCDARLS
jgi:hypothetical protein